MSDLIDTTEMYLRTIYELEEEGAVPMRARIAERLGQSGPTVSQTVARMERDGLVHLSSDRHLELTDDGRRKAVQVMRKHRLAERLLTDVIGLDLPYVHNEACRWEHVMSERVERRLVELLHDPVSSPFGNPIPGLAELGAAQVAPEGFFEGMLSMAQARAEGLGEVTIARLGEHLQEDEAMLATLQDARCVPGITFHLIEGDSGVLLKASGTDDDVTSVPDYALSHIFVHRPVS